MFDIILGSLFLIILFCITIFITCGTIYFINQMWQSYKIDVAYRKEDGKKP